MHLPHVCDGSPEKIGSLIANSADQQAAVRATLNDEPVRWTGEKGKNGQIDIN